MNSLFDTYNNPKWKLINNKSKSKPKKAGYVPSNTALKSKEEYYKKVLRGDTIINKAGLIKTGNNVPQKMGNIQSYIKQTGDREGAVNWALKNKQKGSKNYDETLKAIEGLGLRHIGAYNSPEQSSQRDRDRNSAIKSVNETKDRQNAPIYQAGLDIGRGVAHSFGKTGAGIRELFGSNEDNYRKLLDKKYTPKKSKIAKGIGEFGGELSQILGVSGAVGAGLKGAGALKYINTGKKAFVAGTALDAGIGAGFEGLQAKKGDKLKSAGMGALFGGIPVATKGLQLLNRKLGGKIGGGFDKFMGAVSDPLLFNDDVMKAAKKSVYKSNIAGADKIKLVKEITEQSKKIKAYKADTITKTTGKSKTAEKINKVNTNITNPIKTKGSILPENKLAPSYNKDGNIIGTNVSGKVMAERAIIRGYKQGLRNIDTIKPSRVEFDEQVVKKYMKDISEGNHVDRIVMVGDKAKGDHRLEAYKRLGIKDIPVLEKPSSKLSTAKFDKINKINTKPGSIYKLLAGKGIKSAEIKAKSKELFNTEKTSELNPEQLTQLYNELSPEPISLGLNSWTDFHLGDPNHQMTRTKEGFEIMANISKAETNFIRMNKEDDAIATAVKKSIGSGSGIKIGKVLDKASKLFDKGEFNYVVNSNGFFSQAENEIKLMDLGLTQKEASVAIGILNIFKQKGKLLGLSDEVLNQAYFHHSFKGKNIKPKQKELSIDTLKKQGKGKVSDVFVGALQDRIGAEGYKLDIFEVLHDYNVAANKALSFQGVIDDFNKIRKNLNNTDAEILADIITRGMGKQTYLDGQIRKLKFGNVDFVDVSKGLGTLQTLGYLALQPKQLLLNFSEVIKAFYHNGIGTSLGKVIGRTKTPEAKKIIDAIGIDDSHHIMENIADSYRTSDTRKAIDKAMYYALWFSSAVDNKITKPHLALGAFYRMEPIVKKLFPKLEGKELFNKTVDYARVEMNKALPSMQKSSTPTLYHNKSTAFLTKLTRFATNSMKYFANDKRVLGRKFQDEWTDFLEAEGFNAKWIKGLDALTFTRTYFFLTSMLATAGIHKLTQNDEGKGGIDTSGYTGFGLLSGASPYDVSIKSGNKQGEGLLESDKGIDIGPMHFEFKGMAKRIEDGLMSASGPFLSNASKTFVAPKVNLGEVGALEYTKEGLRDNDVGLKYLIPGGGTAKNILKTFDTLKNKRDDGKYDYKVNTGGNSSTITQLNKAQVIGLGGGFKPSEEKEQYLNKFKVGEQLYDIKNADIKSQNSFDILWGKINDSGKPNEEKIKDKNELRIRYPNEFLAYYKSKTKKHADTPLNIMENGFKGKGTDTQVKWFAQRAEGKTPEEYKQMRIDVVELIKKGVVSQQFIKKLKEYSMNNPINTKQLNNTIK